MVRSLPRMSYLKVFWRSNVVEMFRSLLWWIVSISNKSKFKWIGEWLK